MRRGRRSTISAPLPSKPSLRDLARLSATLEWKVDEESDSSGESDDSTLQEKVPSESEASSRMFGDGSRHSLGSTRIHIPQKAGIEESEHSQDATDAKRERTVGEQRASGPTRALGASLRRAREERRRMGDGGRHAGGWGGGGVGETEGARMLRSRARSSVSSVTSDYDGKSRLVGGGDGGESPGVIARRFSSASSFSLSSLPLPAPHIKKRRNDSISTLGDGMHRKPTYFNLFEEEEVGEGGRSPWAHLDPPLPSEGGMVPQLIGFGGPVMGHPRSLSMDEAEGGIEESEDDARRREALESGKKKFRRALMAVGMKKKKKGNKFRLSEMEVSSVMSAMKTGSLSQVPFSTTSPSRDVVRMPETVASVSSFTDRPVQVLGRGPSRELEWRQMVRKSLTNLEEIAVAHKDEGVGKGGKRMGHSADMKSGGQVTLAADISPTKGPSGMRTFEIRRSRSFVLDTALATAASPMRARGRGDELQGTFVALPATVDGEMGGEAAKRTLVERERRRGGTAYPSPFVEPAENEAIEAAAQKIAKRIRAREHWRRVRRSVEAAGGVKIIPKEGTGKKGLGIDAFASTAKSLVRNMRLKQLKKRGQYDLAPEKKGEEGEEEGKKKKKLVKESSLTSPGGTSNAFNPDLTDGHPSVVAQAYVLWRLGLSPADYDIKWANEAAEGGGTQDAITEYRGVVPAAVERAYKKQQQREADEAMREEEEEEGGVGEEGEEGMGEEKEVEDKFAKEVMKLRRVLQNLPPSAHEGATDAASLVGPATSPSSSPTSPMSGKFPSFLRSSSDGGVASTIGTDEPSHGLRSITAPQGVGGDLVTPLPTPTSPTTPFASSPLATAPPTIARTLSGHESSAASEGEQIGPVEEVVVEMIQKHLAKGVPLLSAAEIHDKIGAAEPQGPRRLERIPLAQQLSSVVARPRAAARRLKRTFGRLVRARKRQEEEEGGEDLYWKGDGAESRPLDAPQPHKRLHPRRAAAYAMHLVLSLGADAAVDVVRLADAAADVQGDEHVAVWGEEEEGEEESRFGRESTASTGEGDALVNGEMPKLDREAKRFFGKQSRIGFFKIYHQMWRRPKVEPEEFPDTDSKDDEAVFVGEKDVREGIVLESEARKKKKKRSRDGEEGVEDDKEIRALEESLLARLAGKHRKKGPGDLELSSSEDEDFDSDGYSTGEVEEEGFGRKTVGGMTSPLKVTGRRERHETLEMEKDGSEAVDVVTGKRHVTLLGVSESMASLATPRAVRDALELSKTGRVGEGKEVEYVAGKAAHAAVDAALHAVERVGGTHVAKEVRSRTGMFDTRVGKLVVSTSLRHDLPGESSPRHAYARACDAAGIAPEPIPLRRHAGDLLDLSEYRLGDARAAALSAALSKLPRLRVLNLSANRLTPASFPWVFTALSHGVGVEGLSLARNRIRLHPSETSKGLRSEQEDSLRRRLGAPLKQDDVCVRGGDLSTRRTALRSISSAAFRTAMPTLAAFLRTPAGAILRWLDLSHCCLDDDAIETLCKGMIRGSAHLTRLDLADNSEIGPLGAKHIAEMLSGHRVLRRLSLAWTSLGDAGVAEIARVLSDSIAPLRRLKLASCGMKDAGAAALGSSLASNTTLRELSLTGNTVTAAGAIVIAGSLATNGALRTLDVSECPLGQQGVRALLPCMTIPHDIAAAAKARRRVRRRTKRAALATLTPDPHDPWVGSSSSSSEGEDDDDEEEEDRSVGSRLRSLSAASSVASSNTATLHSASSAQSLGMPSGAPPKGKHFFRKLSLEGCALESDGGATSIDFSNPNADLELNLEDPYDRSVLLQLLQAARDHDEVHFSSLVYVTPAGGLRAGHMDPGWAESLLEAGGGSGSGGSSGGGGEGRDESAASLALRKAEEKIAASSRRRKRRGSVTLSTTEAKLLESTLGAVVLKAGSASLRLRRVREKKDTGKARWKALRKNLLDVADTVLTASSPKTPDSEGPPSSKKKRSVRFAGRPSSAGIPDRERHLDRTMREAREQVWGGAEFARLGAGAAVRAVTEEDKTPVVEAFLVYKPPESKADVKKRRKKLAGMMRERRGSLGSLPAGGMLSPSAAAAIGIQSPSRSGRGRRDSFIPPGTRMGLLKRLEDFEAEAGEKAKAQMAENRAVALSRDLLPGGRYNEDEETTEDSPTALSRIFQIPFAGTLRLRVRSAMQSAKVRREREEAAARARARSRLEKVRRELVARGAIGSEPGSKGAAALRGLVRGARGKSVRTAGDFASMFSTSTVTPEASTARGVAALLHILSDKPSEKERVGDGGGLEDRVRLLGLAAQDLFLTPEEALQLMRSPAVRAANPEARVDVAAKVIQRLADPSKIAEVLQKSLNGQEQRRTQAKLGLSNWKLLLGFLCGHWITDLSHPLGRSTLARIAAANAEDKNWLATHYPGLDTSQRGDGERLRNATLDGKPFRPRGSWLANPPSEGIFAADFVPAQRPPPRARPLHSLRFAQLLRETRVFEFRDAIAAAERAVFERDLDSMVLAAVEKHLSEWEETAWGMDDEEARRKSKRDAAREARGGGEGGEDDDSPISRPSRRSRRGSSKAPSGDGPTLSQGVRQAARVLFSSGNPETKEDGFLADVYSRHPAWLEAKRLSAHTLARALGVKEFPDEGVGTKMLWRGDDDDDEEGTDVKYDGVEAEEAETGAVVRALSRKKFTPKVHPPRRRSMQPQGAATMLRHLLPRRWHIDFAALFIPAKVHFGDCIVATSVVGSQTWPPPPTLHPDADPPEFILYSNGEITKAGVPRPDPEGGGGGGRGGKGVRFADEPKPSGPGGDVERGASFRSPKGTVVSGRRAEAITSAKATIASSASRGAEALIGALTRGLDRDVDLESLALRPLAIDISLNNLHAKCATKARIPVSSSTSTVPSPHRPSIPSSTGSDWGSREQDKVTAQAIKTIAKLKGDPSKPKEKVSEVKRVGMTRSGSSRGSRRSRGSRKRLMVETASPFSKTGGASTEVSSLALALAGRSRLVRYVTSAAYLAATRLDAQERRRLHGSRDAAKAEGESLMAGDANDPWCESNVPYALDFCWVDESEDDPAERTLLLHKMLRQPAGVGAEDRATSQVGQLIALTSGESSVTALLLEERALAQVAMFVEAMRQARIALARGRRTSAAGQGMFRKLQPESKALGKSQATGDTEVDDWREAEREEVDILEEERAAAQKVVQQYEARRRASQADIEAGAAAVIVEAAAQQIVESIGGKAFTLANPESSLIARVGIPDAAVSKSSAVIPPYRGPPFPLSAGASFPYELPLPPYDSPLVIRPREIDAGGYPFVRGDEKPGGSGTSRSAMRRSSIDTRTAASVAAAAAEVRGAAAAAPPSPTGTVSEIGDRVDGDDETGDEEEGEGGGVSFSFPSPKSPSFRFVSFPEIFRPATLDVSEAQSRLPQEISFRVRAGILLADLLAATSSLLLSSRQLSDLVRLIPLNCPGLRVELVVALFPKIVDLPEFDRVLFALTGPERRIVVRRLGRLNFFDPRRADGDYDLDLSVWEDRVLASILAQLSVVEHGVRLAGSGARGSADFNNITGWKLPKSWFTDTPREGRLRLFFSSLGKGARPNPQERLRLARRVLTFC